MFKLDTTHPVRAVAYVVVIAVIAGFAAFLMLGVSSKNIITDPNDPRFNPMEFKFERYPTQEKICTDKSGKKYDCKNRFPDVIEKMFPPGSKREYVERVLLEKAGAVQFRTEQKNKNIICLYRRISGWPKETAWSVKVEYDQANKVVEIDSWIEGGGF